MALNWESPTSPITSWYQVETGEYGYFLAATAATGLYTSSNSGASWTQRLTNAGRLAISITGQVIVATTFDNSGFNNPSPLKISTNYGVLWIDGVAGKWRDVACSEDGTKLFACGDDYTYASYDSGATWVIIAGGFQSIDCSNNGLRFVGVKSYGGSEGVYVFNKVGSDWFVSGPNPSGPGWTNCAMDGSGSTIVVVGASGIFAKSDSYGVNFDIKNSITDSATDVSISDDASQIAITSTTQLNGFLPNIYLSWDGGVSWTPTGRPAGVGELLAGAGISADGDRISTAIFGGQIYTADVGSAPIPEILTLDATLPMLTVSSSPGISVDIKLPMLILDAIMRPSEGENAFDGTLPMLEFEAWFGGVADAVIPMLTLDAGMTANALISVEITLPMLKLDAYGTGSPWVVTADIRLPMLTVESSLGVSLDAALPMLKLDATMTQGGLLTLDMSIPMLRVSAQGAQQNYGYADITLPMLMPMYGATADIMLPMLNLDAQITAVVTVSYEAYAVNLNHNTDTPIDEVTRYTNYPFTQIVRYQNSYYGVATTGLYLLEGTTDAGTAIPYAVKTAVTDFGVFEKKTISSAYFGGRIGPDMAITLHAGDAGQNTYDFKTPRGQTVQNYREKFGRGVKDRYYALGIAGDDVMELDSIEFDIQKMTRRI